MITASVKTTRKKIIGIICVILSAIIAAILFFYPKSGEMAAESISLRVTNNGERIEYLSSKGVKTAGEPSQVKDVFLPEEMDETLLKYNEIISEAGFDLSPYLGKTVRKYVYPLAEAEETYATIYIYNDKIIAADIASHTEGWQRAIDGGENMG